MYLITENLPLTIAAAIAPGDAIAILGMTVKRPPGDCHRSQGCSVFFPGGTGGDWLWRTLPPGNINEKAVLRDGRKPKGLLVAALIG